MHLAIQELPVDTVLNRDRKARIYHNLACFYQVLAYQQKRFFGHLDQQQLLVRAESLFKEAIDIADLSSTRCAYLNLLYQQNKIDEMITLIQDKRYGSEWFNEGAEVNDDNIQIYSTVEKPVQKRGCFATGDWHRKKYYSESKSISVVLVSPGFFKDYQRTYLR